MPSKKIEFSCERCGHRFGLQTAVAPDGDTIKVPHEECPVCDYPRVGDLNVELVAEFLYQSYFTTGKGGMAIPPWWEVTKESKRPYQRMARNVLRLYLEMGGAVYSMPGDVRQWLMGIALQKDPPTVKKGDTVVFPEGNTVPYGQDHGFWRTPPAGVKFTVAEVWDDRRCILKARGYGEKGHYGNGSIFVNEKDILPYVRRT